MTSLRELADEADGDSVTAARLAGDEGYFPDCRPYLDGLRPQHLVLLTTGSWTIQHVASEHTRRESANRGGVAVVCDRSLLVVVDDSHWEFPYDALGGVGGGYDIVELYLPGPFHVQLRVAKGADEEEVADGLAYLRRRLREA